MLLVVPLPVVLLPVVLSPVVLSPVVLSPVVLLPVVQRLAGRWPLLWPCAMLFSPMNLVRVTKSLAGV